MSTFQYSIHSTGSVHLIQVHFIQFPYQFWATADLVSTDFDEIESGLWNALRWHFYFLLNDFYVLSLSSEHPTLPKFKDMLDDFATGAASHVQMIDRFEKVQGVLKLYPKHLEGDTKVAAEQMAQYIWDFMTNHREVNLKAAA